MPPFIKFQSSTQGTNGPDQKLHFLNTSFIRDAEYSQSNGTLEIFVPEGTAGGGQSFTLSGKEAADALAIFQSLNKPKK